MNFTAIAQRELRTRARHWATYRNRTIAGLVAVGIVTVMLIVGDLSDAMRSMGRAMFVILTWLAFVFCLFEGLRNTVDCLSSEKREGTLGLLFLTDLTSLDILAGKLVANSLTCFYGLLAAFPALAMPFIVGGITAGDFWRMTLALINTLFFALAAGMLISSVGYSERRVWSLGLLVVGLTAGGLPLLDLWLCGGNPASFSPLFSLASPLQAFLASSDKAYRVDPSPFWSGLGFAHLSAWLMLLMGGMTLSRSWQKQGEHYAASQRQEPVWAASVLSKLQAQSDGQAMRSENPVLWLARGNTEPLDRISAVFGLIGVSLIAALYPQGFKNSLVVGIIAGLFWLLHWAIRLRMAVVAAHTTNALRRSGLLELLLVTPIAPAAVARAHVCALQGRLLRPLIFLGMLELICWIAWGTLQDGPLPVFVLLALVFAFGLLVFDLAAVIHVGMWYGLSQSKAHQAATRTIVQVLLLPLIVVIPFGMTFCGLGLPVFFVCKSLLFSSAMKDKLVRNLREAAARDFSPDTEAPWYWPFGRGKKRVAPPPLVPPPLPRA